jgi:hypothetical protein
MFPFERIAKLGGHFVVVEALDRDDFRSVAGHRISDAGADGDAIDQYRAGPAYAVLAAKMRSRQVFFLAQKIREMRARLDFARNGLAIHD